MKIWITFYNDKIFMNIKNFLRKLFGLKYSFLRRTREGFKIVIWHDRTLGKPIQEQTVYDFDTELLKVLEEQEKSNFSNN
jgi:hypothetical protein